MDYNLKKENRKKFQDKSKLKRHHKKDYSKVIPKNSTDNIETKPTDESETEYEDVSDPEVDEQGRFVLHGDEIEALNDEGVTVVRRKKIDKTKTNVWRYRDELEITGLDQDEEELVKSIDFTKLNFDTIDSKQDKVKDIKKLTNDELRNLKIIDSKFDDPDSTYDKSEDDIDDLEALLNSKSEKPRNTSETQKSQQPSSSTQPQQKYQNKTPAALKSDEAFLDDLL